MVGGLEDKVVPRPVDKPFAEVLDSILKLLGHQHLVGQRSEREVKVVGELGVLEGLGLVCRKRLSG